MAQRSCISGWLLLASVGFLLTACGGDGSAAPSSTSTQADIGQPAVARDKAPGVSDDDLAATVAGNTQFALNAFVQLDPSNNGNLVFSPYSVTESVGMLSAGARANTLYGINQAMSFSLPQDRLYPSLNKLNQLLAAETNGNLDANAGQLPNLNLVNSIWAQRGLPLQASFLDTLGLNFGAGVNQVDFIRAPDAALTDINGWVAQQTHGDIQNLLSSAAITSATRLVLTNATWFKASWLTPFPAAATQNQAFYALDGTQPSVPFMQGQQPAMYVQTEDAQAVDIPYAGGKLSMLVLMPNKGNFSILEAGLTQARLDAIVSRLSPYSVLLSLPKFSFNSSPNISSVLQTSGMSDAFSPLLADLSGIDGQHDLFTSAVIQKAFVSVDEKGTEAAAATATTVGTTVVPVMPSTAMTVDQPFLFFIRDLQTGTILFMGKVVNPA